jgi:5-methylthioadenosine/S-adenosylhomocysteine deaminase
VISGLVYSATGAEVDTVMVDGEILMEGRKLTGIDEEEVYAAVQAITERLGMGETEA